MMVRKSNLSKTLGMFGSILFFGLYIAGRAMAQKEIYDTQEEIIPRLTPDEAVASMTLPPGFEVDVFAAEPHVQQPIASAWDSRGRLWVAENYTYAESQRNFDTALLDRIIIFEDRDKDGKFDQRKVFWDKASKLTSVEVGFGGIWALCPPQLLFIPDLDGDDQPDGPPQVILDGFEADNVRHNFVNGLRWGMDGWLYGRHGIQATSFVGFPDQAIAERTALNCCIWRLHPQTKRFEIVCQGTTNPWGMDWDEHGHLFFINTVIGHLWHALPNAHFERMYGVDLDPYVYRLLPQVADHVHWNSAGEDWLAVRKIGISKETDLAGGGHAHSGLLIYQADQWPKEYRGELFTLNFHGLRLNREHLERQGAGFVGRHRPDFIMVGDKWFRGIDLTVGPDGAVYVLDWSDIGECHENDGIHRHSGRIYRIRYGNVAPTHFVDLRAETDSNLIAYLTNANVWFARQARLVLHERMVAGKLDAESEKLLWQRVQESKSAREKLEHLWTAHVCDLTTTETLLPLLSDENEHVRLWAIKLLAEMPETKAETMSALLQLLKRENSSLVHLYLASLLNQFSGEGWWELASLLATNRELASDRDYPLVLWYALKDRSATHPKEAVNVVRRNPIAPISEFLARRLTSQIQSVPEGVELLLEALEQSEQRAEILNGMVAALRGRRKVEMPKAWPTTRDLLEQDSDSAVRQLAASLGVIFGQGNDAAILRDLIADSKQDGAARRDALRSLIEAGNGELREYLWKLAFDRDLGDVAIRGFSAHGTVDDAQKLADLYAKFSLVGKTATIQTLTERSAFIEVLLLAVADGRVPREAVDASALRQMQLLGESSLLGKIESLWPHVKLIAQDKLHHIQALEQKFANGGLDNADLKSGRLLWNQHCASCHRLFGEGAAIGPELTGSQRSNVRYLLENIIDPSASVADNFRVSTYLLATGQVISGVPIAKSPGSVTIQTAKEQIVIAAEDIEDVKASTLSLMPEGLLDALTESQQRDLFAYLQSPTQVPLPSKEP